MARGFSKVILMGNLTRDIEVRTTASGQNVANFTLAVTRTWRNQNGQNQDQTSFINCVAWGRTAASAGRAGSGAARRASGGRLDQRSYDDKDGNKRSVVEVTVEDFTFVGGGRADGNTTPAAAPANSGSSQDVVIEDIDDKPIDLSEIPF